MTNFVSLLLNYRRCQKIKSQYIKVRGSTVSTTVEEGVHLETWVLWQYCFLCYLKSRYMYMGTYLPVPRVRYHIAWLPLSTATYRTFQSTWIMTISEYARFITIIIIIFGMIWMVFLKKFPICYLQNFYLIKELQTRNVLDLRFFFVFSWNSYGCPASSGKEKTKCV